MNILSLSVQKTSKTDFSSFSVNVEQGQFCVVFRSNETVFNITEIIEKWNKYKID